VTPPGPIIWHGDSMVTASTWTVRPVASRSIHRGLQPAASMTAATTAVFGPTLARAFSTLER